MPIEITKKKKGASLTEAQKNRKARQKKKGLDVSQPLPATVRDAKTGKTKKFKTEKLNKANRTARGAELREDTTTGKALNRAMLGVAAIADGVRAASGTKKGSGPSSYMAPATRAGMKAADIKKERNAKEMKAGGKVRGVGKARQGVRKAKIVVMKGS